MALFRRNTVTITLEKKIEKRGVILSIQQDEKPLALPVRLTMSETKSLTNIEQMQLLEDLWFDQKLLEVDKSSYLLSFDDLYQLEPEERAIIDLPSHPTPIKMKIENESFVGSKTFKFVPHIHAERYANLHKIGSRKGAVIQLPSKETLLLEKRYYNLLETIENAPDPRNSDDLFFYIAKVKKEAKSLGIPFSEHIEREEYDFIDEVSINVERTDNGINFNPSYNHTELDDASLTEISKTASGYAKLGSKRVFVDQKAREKTAKVQQMESIQGQDIPKFVQNPSAFIPEDIDISLEDFGIRVKSLGIRVYQAQPFIHANKSDNGWFEYDTGFQVRDDEGNSITEELDDFFSEGNQDFKQLDDNTFVEAPDNVKDFQDLATKIKEEAKQNPSSQIIPSHYILEIFENITNIEFNQPIQELREQLNNEQVFSNKPPKEFTATLKPFQQDGFVWMKSLRFTGYGGLLADDMGLGKTIQVIAYLAYLKEMDRITPTLLVLPKTLIDNWKNEMAKFAPFLTENIYVHIGAGRLKDPAVISTFDIVLTTYQTLIRDQLVIGRVDWQMVICDEAQAIKNPSTGASVVVKALKNKGRIALTGTPVENNLTELWSIVDFVQPGILGSLKEFRNSYESRLDDESNYDAIQKEIESKLRFIYKRRTKAGELNGQLPSKKEYNYLVPMGKKQDEMYRNILKQIKDKEIPAIKGIQDLKMLSSHPGLVDDSLKSINIKNVPKLVKTIELLHEIKIKGEKAIIFTEYRKMQAILKQAIINEFELNPVIINGTVDHRQAIIDHFNQKDGFDILILAPKAAGTGLTITGANHVIHYTRWWNPAVEMQATDRVYRIGQDKNVSVYYPIVTSDAGGKSVEEVIDKLLSKKKALAENVIVPSKDIDIEKEVLGQVVN